MSEAREARVRKVACIVHFVTRLETWDDSLKRFVWRYVMLWLSEVTRSGESGLPLNTQSLERMFGSD